jgi:hypothetical protein
VFRTGEPFDEDLLRLFDLFVDLFCAELDAPRRVAILVAEGVRPEDFFTVVAEEIARVVEVPLCGSRGDIGSSSDGSSRASVVVTPSPVAAVVSSRWAANSPAASGSFGSGQAPS